MLIQTQNPSNVSSVVFTSGITSSNQTYRLMFDSVVCPGGAGSNYLLVQLSDDGGSTYKTTGYINYLGGGVTDGLSVALINDSSVDFTTSGSINLFNMTSGSSFVSCAGLATFFDGSSTMAGQQHHGVYNGSPLSVDALRIKALDGSNFSGNFYLYSYDM